MAGALPLLVGRKKSILIFESFFALAYLIILTTHNPIWPAAAFFMSGLCRGAASNYCNTKINALAPGKAWIINGLHAMFSIGAFAFPILLTLVTMSKASNWVYVCAFMLVMGIITWFLYLMIPEDEEITKNKKDNNNNIEQVDGRDTLGFFKDPIFYLVICTLFFYLCAEQGVIGWMITYFKDTGYLNSTLSGITASVQWLMILFGRITAAWLSTRFDKSRLLQVMGIGLVIFFLLLIMSRTPLLIMIGIIGFGFSMAGIYPTTVSFAGSLIQRYSMAWSFILTIASFGSIIMPVIIGKIAANSGIAVGMSSVAVVVFIDLAAIMALCTYMKRQKA